MLARRLRQETTMSLEWIAERLQMGTWAYLNESRAGFPNSQPEEFSR
jgi:hypothetical protein